MPKYRICFRVESVEEGSIEVEAETPQAAAEAFIAGEYEEQRASEPNLDLMDSEDSVAEVQSLDHPEQIYIPEG